MVGGDYITTERGIKQFCISVVKSVYYVKQTCNIFLGVNAMLTWRYVSLTGIAYSPVSVKTCSMAHFVAKKSLPYRYMAGKRLLRENK